MKKLTLLFAMIVFAFGNAFAQSLYFDFEGQTAGNKIAATLGDPWTTWSNAPGGGEDGVFDMADGSMAAHFTYGNDQVLRLGGIETGVFDLVFDAYVPNGKNGYFNVLHHFAGGGSTWAAQFYLCATNDGQSGTETGEGHGTVHAGSNGTADIPCVWDQWMKYRVHINMDLDLATLYWNIAGEPEQEICTWQWSLDSFGESVVGRTLDAMDFYPPENANSSEFYIDNIGIVDGAEDQVLINDDFEVYTVGNNIAVEAQNAQHPWWTTWSNAPGGEEDGVVANYNGTKCAHLTYGNDQVLLLGDEESGSYDLEFDILVPEGKNGYFNILHDFNGGSSTWALECYLHMAVSGTSTVHSPGSSFLNVAGGEVTGPTVIYDDWMHFRLHVNTDTDVAEYYYTAPSGEETLVYSWQWSLDTQGTVYGRKLAAMDFFPPQNAANSEYYLDNVTFTKFGAETAASLDFDTDELYVELESDDVATMNIGIENNGTSIGDWTAWIDFGMGQGGSNTTQINYDSEPGANTSLVGFNYEEPVLIEVAAMFPGVSYAGAAMGTSIISVQYYAVESSGGFGFEENMPLTFRVYEQGMYGQPGEILAEKVIPYNQINHEDWTVATFDTPVPLTGYNVWISCEYTQAVDGYAMAFDGTSYTPNSGFYRTQGGGAFASLGPDNLSSDYGNLQIRANVQGAPVTASWANLDKSEGSMPIGGTDNLLVTINTFGLSDGSVYDAHVFFKTNDPQNPEVSIPLTLHVGLTGVADITNEMASVYPNPATNRVVVEGENLTAVAIYNLAGQLIRVERLDSVINTIEMNVEAGIYFFNIYDNNGRTGVQRVVISK